MKDIIKPPRLELRITEYQRDHYFRKYFSLLQSKGRFMSVVTSHDPCDVTGAHPGGAGRVDPCVGQCVGRGPGVRCGSAAPAQSEPAVCEAWAVRAFIHRHDSSTGQSQVTGSHVQVKVTQTTALIGQSPRLSVIQGSVDWINKVSIWKVYSFLYDGFHRPCRLQ